MINSISDWTISGITDAFKDFIQAEAKEGKLGFGALSLYILENIRKSCAENERLNVIAFLNQLDSGSPAGSVAAPNGNATQTGK